MKKLSRNALAFAIGAVLGTLLIEGIFRQLPVPIGLYRSELHQQWPLINYEPHRRYTSSMSWDMQHVRRGTTNNYGHLAPFDYQPRSHPVVVIGDSFVGAATNHYRDTLQGQLGELLGHHEAVYGLGANGLSISDYLALSAQAAKEFAPRAAVFLLIDGDVSESLLNQIGHYNFSVKNGVLEMNYRPLYGETFGKKMRRIFGDSALYRYFQLNLLFDPMRLIEKAARSPIAQTTGVPLRMGIREVSEKAVVDHFLEQVTVTLRLPPRCVALLFHSDTYAIADPASETALKDAPSRMEYLKTKAKAMGYRVVDLLERFRSDYARHGKRLDYWPLDRHLNGRGHSIAARAAFDTLFHPEAGKSCPPEFAEGHPPPIHNSGPER